MQCVYASCLLYIGSSKPVCCFALFFKWSNYSSIHPIVLILVEEIAKIKLPDLNTNDVQMAMNIVGGTARNMGIEIVE